MLTKVTLHGHLLWLDVFSGQIEYGFSQIALGHCYNRCTALYAYRLK
jgi:hypothetical protein